MKGNEQKKNRMVTRKDIFVACCLDEIAVPFMFLQASHSLLLFVPTSCLYQLVIT
jgi:hypothetical protein